VGIETPNDIDRAAIEEHAQRTVEQTALRKVRRTLDEIEKAAAAGRLRPGQRVVSVAFGSGVTWGGVALEWTGQTSR